MKITLNGNAKELEKEISLTELLDQLGLAGKPVVVEHNKEAIFPRDYPEIIVQDSDELEIISIAAGG